MWHSAGLFAGLTAVWLAASVQDAAAQPGSGSGKPGGTYGFPSWDSRWGNYDRLRRPDSAEEAQPEPRGRGYRQGGPFGKQPFAADPPEKKGPRGPDPKEGKKGPPEAKGLPEAKKGPPGFGPRWGGGSWPGFGKEKAPPPREEAKKPTPPSKTAPGKTPPSKAKTPAGKTPPAWAKGHDGKGDWRGRGPQHKGPAFGKGPHEGHGFRQGHGFGYQMGARRGPADHRMGAFGRHGGHAFGHQRGHGMSGQHHGQYSHGFAQHSRHGFGGGRGGRQMGHHSHGFAQHSRHGFGGRGGRQMGRASAGFHQGHGGAAVAHSPWTHGYGYQQRGGGRGQGHGPAHFGPRPQWFSMGGYGRGQWGASQHGGYSHHFGPAPAWNRR